MKKKFLVLSFFAMTGMNIAMADNVNLVVGIYDPTPATNPLPKTPIHIPNVDLNGFTLTFTEGHADFTLSIIDENDNIVYSVYVPSSVTTVNLPSTLSGDYKLCLYPDGSTIYFFGYIML